MVSPSTPGASWFARTCFQARARVSRCNTSSISDGPAVVVASCDARVACDTADGSCGFRPFSPSPASSMNPRSFCRTTNSESWDHVEEQTVRPLGRLHALLRPRLTSAAASRPVAGPVDAGRHDGRPPQVSSAIFAPRPPHLPPRPPDRYGASPCSAGSPGRGSLMRFVFLGSGLCLRLLSHERLAATQLPSANSSPCQGL